MLYKISIQTESINLGYALLFHSKMQNVHFIHWHASLGSAKSGSTYAYLPAIRKNKSLLILGLNMMQNSY